MPVPPERLSRLMSHALRHQPWRYELELDAEGWVPVEQLLAAIHEQGARWAEVGRGDVVAMMAAASKQRFELSGDRIRALYGHSVPGRIVREAAPPPAELFHGTAPAAWPTISTDGLRPMRRQYVHLSVDVETAHLVGSRRAADPVILSVDAARAAGDGVPFWRGNDAVWLAEHVPAAYLTVRGPTP